MKDAGHIGAIFKFFALGKLKLIEYEAEGVAVFEVGDGLEIFVQLEWMQPPCCLRIYIVHLSYKIICK